MAFTSSKPLSRPLLPEAVSVAGSSVKRPGIRTNELAGEAPVVFAGDLLPTVEGVSTGRGLDLIGEARVRENGNLCEGVSGGSSVKSGELWASLNAVLTGVAESTFLGETLGVFISF